MFRVGKVRIVYLTILGCRERQAKKDILDRQAGRQIHGYLCPFYLHLRRFHGDLPHLRLI